MDMRTIILFLTYIIKLPVEKIDKRVGLANVKDIHGEIQDEMQHVNDKTALVDNINNFSNRLEKMDKTAGLANVKDITHGEIQDEMQHVNDITALVDNINNFSNRLEMKVLEETQKSSNNLMKILQRLNLINNHSVQDNKKSQKEIHNLRADMRGNFKSFLRNIQELMRSANQTITFINQSHSSLDERIQDVGKEMKCALTTLHNQLSNDINELKSDINSEIDHIRWLPLYIKAVEFFLIILLVFIWGCKGKSDNKHQLPEIIRQEPMLENSVAIVSFARNNMKLHEEIALSVISSWEWHPVDVSGMTNESISTFDLNSKVCLVFVDKNERNIILETEKTTSRMRASFVEGQVKRGKTQVIVIYCQHEGSRSLERLYDRSLGNIKKQETLRQLQGQNRVLSIDRKFSTYQSTYLKMFLTEIMD